MLFFLKAQAVESIVPEQTVPLVLINASTIFSLFSKCQVGLQSELKENNWNALMFFSAF